MKILITADWHVRGEKPICRTEENWIDSQRKTISEIRSAFVLNKCDQIWILGDLFDSPRCSTEAVNMLIDELKKFPYDSVKILCGNHDLKDHNYENLEGCSIGTVLKFFDTIPCRFSISPLKISANAFGLDDEKSDAQIICTHQLTFPDEKSRPVENCGVLAQDLLDKWRNAEIIFTGDYHHGYIYKETETTPFMVVASGRYVVTPGCINIQKADELDYKPFVVIWDVQDSTETKFEKIYLDPQIENCTRDHIEEREKNESMLSEVVETIKGGTEITLDFDSNLEEQVKKTTPAIINEYELMRQDLNGEK